jgi:hypothetical protein
MAKLSFFNVSGKITKKGEKSLKAMQLIVSDLSEKAVETAERDAEKILNNSKDIIRAWPNHMSSNQGMEKSLMLSIREKDKKNGRFSVEIYSTSIYGKQLEFGTRPRAIFFGEPIDVENIKQRVNKNTMAKRFLVERSVKLTKAEIAKERKKDNNFKRKVRIEEISMIAYRNKNQKREFQKSTARVDKSQKSYDTLRDWVNNFYNGEDRPIPGMLYIGGKNSRIKLGASERKWLEPALDKFLAENPIRSRYAKQIREVFRKRFK